MVTAQPQGWEKLPTEIMNLVFQREQLKWYQFSNKKYLDQRIKTLKAIGWNVGVQIALDDLEN